MKRRKILLNILIIIVAIFFATRVFSYFKNLSHDKKSKEIYLDLEKTSKDASDEIDFDNLKSINKDIVAWIKSGEGSIDYPLVQCEDNEKYLRTAANGDTNIFGAIFLDYRNNSLDDPLVLIYGHMTKNRSMFGSLNDFKDQPSHDDFTIYREGSKIRTKAVLGGIISGETMLDPRDFSSFDKRQDFYNFIRSHAVYDTGYELKEDDKLINLVTCTYEKRNSRLVLVTIIED